jgi:hypothetical protein
VISAANLVGNIGIGGVYTVASVIDSNSITYTATGGTSGPLAGTIGDLVAFPAFSPVRTFPSTNVGDL